MVVTGDVSLEDARREVEKAFGGRWGRRRGDAASRPREPAVAAPRVEVIRDDAKEAHLAISFPVPARSPGCRCARRAGVVLGQADSSRLDVQVKRSAWPRRAGVRLHPAGSGDVQRRADAGARADRPGRAGGPRGAQRLTREPSTRRSWRRPVQLEADAIYQRETVQGLARRLGFFEVEAGGEEGERRYYEEIAALKPAAIQAVAERYLQPKHQVAVAIHPEAGPAFDSKDFERLLRPPAPPRRGSRPRNPL